MADFVIIKARTKYTGKVSENDRFMAGIIRTNYGWNKFIYSDNSDYHGDCRPLHCEQEMDADAKVYVCYSDKRDVWNLFSYDPLYKHIWVKNCTKTRS